jgi:hypothetical protein
MVTCILHLPDIILWKSYHRLGQKQWPEDVISKEQKLNLSSAMLFVSGGMGLPGFRKRARRAEV